MNLFAQSIIQDRVKDFFTHCIESDRLAHAYIFYGKEGAGKEAFAFELAKTLNCASTKQRPCNQCPPCIKINHLNHPDIKYIFPISKQLKPENIAALIKEKAANPYKESAVEGHRNIAIETIRELKNEAKYAPYEAAKRFFIIYGAEYLQRAAANSFLKLLEEPPDNLIIILITNDLNALIDTIRSRCQPVYFPRFSDEQIEKIVKQYENIDKDIKAMIRTSQNNIKQVFNMLYADSENEREIIYNFIRAVASKNMLEISNVINVMTQSGDKNNLMNLLNLIILWLNDSIHYLILNDSEDFINLDYAESITKFAKFYQNSDFERLIGFVEKAYFDIQRNAHAVLTLTNLAIEMKNHLIRTTSPIEEVT